MALAAQMLACLAPMLGGLLTASGVEASIAECMGPDKQNLPAEGGNYLQIQLIMIYMAVHHKTHYTSL